VLKVEMEMPPYVREGSFTVSARWGRKSDSSGMEWWVKRVTDWLRTVMVFVSLARDTTNTVAQPAVMC